MNNPFIQNRGVQERAARIPSQNARRHGVTGAVSSHRTLELYRSIVETPDAAPPSALADALARHAWSLAESEAQLERALKAERAHLFGINARQHNADPLQVPNRYASVVLDTDALRSLVQHDIGDINELVAQARQAAFWRDAARLQRYRSEAETRRARASKDYAKALLEAQYDPKVPSENLGGEV